MEYRRPPNIQVQPPHLLSILGKLERVYGKAQKGDVGQERRDKGSKGQPSVRVCVLFVLV